MDASISSICTVAMGKPGVLGIVLVDAQGLCLRSEGTVPADSMGAIAELAVQAQGLSGDDGAVITVESAQSKVLISRSSGVTTALFMKPGSSS